MKRWIGTGLALLPVVVAAGEAGTDASLFLKNAPEEQLESIESESGDLFKQAGHHGPAVENHWLGLRIYFDRKAAIDVYSKARPGLELEKARWYPTPEQQKSGMGTDYYKAGEGVGLGGVRLWDGKQVVALEPVTRRSARVVKEGGAAFMEMLSEGVPYMGRKVDVLQRVTVFSGIRQAKVEVWAMTDEPVRFVTGVNFHDGQQVKELVLGKRGAILTWGLHPEDVASERVELGAAIVVNPDDFPALHHDSAQKTLISKPAKHLEWWVTSACGKEPGMDGMEPFEALVKKDFAK